MKNRFWVPIICLLAAVVVDGSAQSPEFLDRVGTLETSRPLPSRGNLGGVAVDRLGFIYVANFREGVWKISPEGKTELLAKSLYGSSGNAVDSRGNLYQANFFGNTVSRISRTGHVTEFASEGLLGPVGIAVDAGDALYVCNCSGNTVVKISQDGKTQPFAKSDLFACPNGITFDDQQNLYVTNFNNHDIVKITPTGEVGKFTTIPGGAGNAHIVFSKGFFYVTKIVANLIMKVSRDGEATTLAGTGQPGHKDGPARESSFAHPNGIAVSPQGDTLYVNTLVGEYSKPNAALMTLRTIRLRTLRDLLEETLEAEGLEAAEAIYKRYKSDPVRGRENTASEMITYGYSLLSNRKLGEALKIFQLNAASYPDSAPVQYHLGEAYRYTGQTEKAAEQYRKTLSLDPDFAQAASRLKQLGG